MRKWCNRIHLSSARASAVGRRPPPAWTDVHRNDADDQATVAQDNANIAADNTNGNTTQAGD